MDFNVGEDVAKTPVTMLIERFGHDVVNSITWNEPQVGKRIPYYICNIVIEGQSFCGQGMNKKAAKHNLASEVLNVYPSLSKASIHTKPNKGTENTKMFASTAPLKQEVTDGFNSGDKRTNSRETVESLGSVMTPLGLLETLTQRPGEESDCVADVYEADNVPNPDPAKGKLYECMLTVKGETVRAWGHSHVGTKFLAAKIALKKMFRYEGPSVDERVVEFVLGFPLLALVNKVCEQGGCEPGWSCEDISDNDYGIPVFQGTYTIDGQCVSGKPERNKKEAKHSACRAVFLDLFNMSEQDVDKIINDSRMGVPKQSEVRYLIQTPQSVLLSLCVEKHRGEAPPNLPEYALISDSGESAGTSQVTVKVSVGDKHFEGLAQTKAAAKAQCASKAVKELFARTISEETILVEKRKEKRTPAEIAALRAQWYAAHAHQKKKVAEARPSRGRGWRHGGTIGTHDSEGAYISVGDSMVGLESGSEGNDYGERSSCSGFISPASGGSAEAYGIDVGMNNTDGNSSEGYGSWIGNDTLDYSKGSYPHKATSSFGHLLYGAGQRKPPAWPDMDSPTGIVFNSHNDRYRRNEDSGDDSFEANYRTKPLTSLHRHQSPRYTPYAGVSNNRTSQNRLYPDWTVSPPHGGFRQNDAASSSSYSRSYY